MEYMTLTQIAECGRYPFSVGQLRGFLLFRKENQLERAIRKIGRRVYFKMDLFNQWIEAHGEQPAPLK